jgi:hypothetical protein
VVKHDRNPENRKNHGKPQKNTVRGEKHGFRDFRVFSSPYALGQVFQSASGISMKISAMMQAFCVVNGS